MSDKIFAEGIYFDRRESAPEFVVGRLGIDRDRLVAWLNKQDVSERGYLNLNILNGKNGKAYVELDTWKPDARRSGSAQETRSAPTQYGGGGAYAGRDEVPYDDEIPF